MAASTMIELPLPGQVATPEQMEEWLCRDYPTCRHGERCRQQVVAAEPSPVCFRAVEARRPVQLTLFASAALCADSAASAFDREGA